MTPGSSSEDAAPRSAEERAEELMTRVTADASRVLTRFFGRAREELEDIVAEGRARHDQSSQRE